MRAIFFLSLLFSDLHRDARAGVEAGVNAIDTASRRRGPRAT
jgi:hypothetical protein